MLTKFFCQESKKSDKQTKLCGRPLCLLREERAVL